MQFENVKESKSEEEENQEIHYFYNREERLARAPQSVKDYYDGKIKPLRGFKVLFKNKTNFYSLIALVFFVGVVWFLSAYTSHSNFGKIENLNFELNAFSYQDDVYVSLKVNDKNSDEESKTETIEAEVSFINQDNKIQDVQNLELLYLDGEDSLRTKTTDYDIIKVNVIVRACGKEIELSTAVK